MATPEELASVRPRLLGMIDESRIRTTRIPRPDRSVIDGFLGLTDLCSTVSDALDSQGVGGAVPASILSPVISGLRICGPAITLHYLPVGGSVGARYARDERPLLADRDLYGVGQPGDVAVLCSDAGPGISVLGGLSATWAHRAGIAACIVDGGVRDISTIRDVGQPVWSAGRTPITGRHRVAAMEINGGVSLAGVPVYPGDLIVADDTGVCVVPQDHIGLVLAQCLAADDAESTVLRMLRAGADVADVVAVLPAHRW